MSFPADPLKIVTELFYDSAWHDISPDVFNRDPVSISRGKANEGAAVDPGSCHLTLNNGRSRIAGTVGRYSPRNPRSDLFGKFGRGTLLRVSVMEGSAFLEGGPNAASTPDAAALDITGDIDLRWEGEGTWYEPGARILMGKWGAAGNRSYHMRIENQRLYIHVTTDGTTGTAFQWLLPDGLPKRAAFRATLDVDNGAGGATARLYRAASLDGPWLQIGNDISIGSTIAIFASSASLSVAPQQADELDAVDRFAFSGRVYRAEVRSGIDGTVVAAPNFEAQTPGTLSFTDSAGRVWGVAAGALSNRRVRFVGEVAEWPTRWNENGSNNYVPLVASGVLRRMTQGRKALDSALRRRVPGFAPLSYWPMEEGQDATEAGNLGRGGSLKVAPVNWAAVDTLPSSNPLPTLSTTSGIPCQLFGSVPAPAVSSSEWSVQFMYRLDTAPTIRRTILRIISTGTVANWYIQSSNTGTTVLGRDDNGATVFSQGIGTGLDLFGQWVRVEFNAVQEGINVHWQITWTDVGGDAGVFGTTFPGTVGRVVAVASPPDGYAAELDGMALGHISAWPVAHTAAYDRAVDGWAGETAGARMLRLASEESFPLVVADDPTTHALVGPQFPEALLDTIQDAANADIGILSEQRDAASLRYRGRTSFYNQPVGLTLDFNARGLVTPVEPVDDDQQLRNERTVERRNGSSALAVLETGPLSVSDVGLYDDSTTLNLFDDPQTDQTAWWYLRMGTINEARYPVISVDLRRAPSLISAVADMEIGDRLQVANPPEWLPPGLIDQRAEGYTETLTISQWFVDFNCSPHSVWNVGETDGREEGLTDATSLGRADTDGSELSRAHNAAETSVDVRVTEGPVWVRAQPSLNANASFETNLTGWVASNGSIARVAVPNPPTDGKWCLQFTPNGTASTPNAQTTQMPITAGNSYVVSGWLRCVRSRLVGLNVNWYNSSGAFMSTSASSATVTAGMWRYFENTVTAPAGAAFAAIAATVPNTPPATDVLLLEQATLRPAVGTTVMPREFPFSVTTGGEEMWVQSVRDFVDTFSRTVVDGWGTSETGGVWDTTLGADANYSVSGGTGIHTHPTAGIAQLSLLPSPTADVDLQTDVTTSVMPTGNPIQALIVARATNDANWYGASLEFRVDGTIRLTIGMRVNNNSGTTIAGPLTLPATHAVGTFQRLRFKIIGSTLQAKAWPVGSAEPDWQLTTTSTQFTAAGNLGLRSFRGSGNTNTGAQVLLDNFQLLDIQQFGVQRSINGVVKVHAAGQPISLTHPAIVAL